MILRKKVIFCVLLIPVLWSGELPDVVAQEASIQGIITDYSTGQPLYGANVVLQSLSDEDEILGTAADNEGFYQVSSIDPGRYVFQISYIGYTAYTDTLGFEEGENRTLNTSLKPGGAQLDELVVSQSTGAVLKSEGRQRITSVELSRVPGPATGDLATYLQTLPGVVAMGDRGGQVFIRGGTPAQNLVKVDGATVYRPTHIVGFFSPFPQDLVSGVDFYAGGFGPRYNSRTSSVMDIQLRHGNRRQTTGTAGLSPFAAEVFAEGPLLEGKSSWMVSLRNSTIERTSGWYPIEKQPLKFGSQFLKTSFIDQNSRCSALLMNTYDRGQMDFETNESIRWSNFVLGGSCVALPQSSRTLMDTNVNISRFSNSQTGQSGSDLDSNIWQINIDVNMRQYRGDVRLEYGLYTRMERMDFDIGQKYAGLNRGDFTQFVTGGYLQTSIPLGERLSLQPGAALTVYPGGYPLSLEPRFRFNWQPFGNESEQVSGATGIYRQSVVGISDMRDASSVFVAWMNSPIGESQMEAIHGMLGWQQTIGDAFSWSLEGYYKRMLNQPVPVWNTIAQFTTELALADGHVYGGDLRLEYNRGNFYGMVGYGYSWTMYEAAQDHFNEWFDEPVQQYHPPHDRRHQLNALFSLTMGKYEAGLRWQLGTGVPYTRPMGFDDILDFRERLPDVKNDQGTRRVILDKPYQGRLPAVHRLDVSLERTFRISDSGAAFTAELGAVNTYGQRNIFYYDVYTHRRIDQLPLVPYLTLKMELGE